MSEDIEKLKALRLALKSGEYDGTHIMQSWLLVDKFIQLQAENEQLRKDAERYRWVLSKAKITDFIFNFLKSDERHVNNAIDNEMKDKL